MNQIHKDLSGVQKAAIVMLALGEENCTRLFEQMREEEIREISIAMARLGVVSSQTVEEVCLEFSHGLGEAEGFFGGLENTERLLSKALPPGKVADIMEEIRGPVGRTMWDKLGNVPETVLANYLTNEYPQTAAVILTKIKPLHAAKVLELFPQEISIDIITRMLNVSSVSKKVMKVLEDTLKSEFIYNISKGSSKNSHEIVADIFNNFDRRTEGILMSALGGVSQDDAEKIKSLMFTFDDILKIRTEEINILLGRVPREILPLSLKGVDEILLKKILSSMSARSGRILLDEISSLGAVRMKDVEAAQNEIIFHVKELVESGEIEIISEEDSGSDLVN